MHAICGDFSLNSSSNLKDDSASMTPIAHYGRFAPSPTGPLHAGSLLAAFGSWLHARHGGAGWRMRVEDVDPPRTVPGAAAAQLRTLHHFGLRGDGAVMWQSERGAAYQQALDTLLRGGHAFVCHCSRRDLAATGGIHHACVARAPRPDPAVRFRVPPGTRVEFVDAVRGPQWQAVHATVGDFVLRRADGCWAYQLAVVVDDAAQGVTEVVRGADLLDSTARQILLQRALGLPVPCHAHLPLLLGADGAKLSKSQAAPSVAATPPTALLCGLWTLLGQRPGLLSQDMPLHALLDAAVAGFDPALLPRTDIVLPDSARDALMLQNPVLPPDRGTTA